MQVELTRLESWMNDWAPWDMAEPWDNVGVLVRSSETVTGVVCCLDITPAAVAFAQEMGCNTLVSHHPVIFHPLKSLAGQPAVLAAVKQLNAVCAHTNLDKAPGGTSDILARTVGLENVRQEDAFCYTGALPCALTVEQLAGQVGQALRVPVQYTAALATRSVRRAAVVSGAGGSFYMQAKALAADCLITGEAGHHDFLDAEVLGLPVIAAGHWGTEQLVAPLLAARLRKVFPGLPVHVYEQPAPAAWLAMPQGG